MNIHDDYYHSVEHDAKRKLAELTDSSPAETCTELVEQLQCALKHGNSHELAHAIVSAIDARHAYHELQEHEEHE